MKQKFEFSLDEANPFAVVSFSSQLPGGGGKCPIRNLLYEGGTFFIPRRLLFPSLPLGASFNSPSRLFFALTDSRTECSSSSSEEEEAAPSYPPLHHRRYPLGKINFFLFAHSSDFFSQLNFILQGFHARTSTRSKQAHKKYKKTFSKVHFHKITPRTEALPE